MAKRKIKDAKDLDTGELIYIKGHAKATYMSDGRTVEDAIKAGGGGGGGGIAVETDPIFSASPAATITEEKIAEWNSKSAQGEKGDKGDTGVGVQSVAQTITSNADGGSNIVTVALTDGTKSTFTVKNGSKGSNGSNGTNGKDGADGEDGVTFTPSVDSVGNLSWTNNGGLTNPPTVNIKGPKGDKGDAGGGGGTITESDIAAMGFTKNTGDYSKPSGGIPEEDLAENVRSALRDAAAYKGTVIGVKANNSTKMPADGIVDLGTVGTYSKPSTGIPKSDLNPSVQTSLGKADTAVQPADIKDEVYIADFTMESLKTAIRRGLNVECNVQALVDAMNANKVILVREAEDSSYKGVYVLNGYAEDLLYFSIVDAYGSILWCEGTDYIYLQGIEGQSLRERNWDSKQDTLKSGENIKTINGKSILGSGNITIEGGGSGGGGNKEIIEWSDIILPDAEPNKIYICDPLGGLSITLAPTDALVDEWVFHIVNCDSLMLPDNVLWAGGEVPNMPGVNMQEPPKQMLEVSIVKTSVSGYGDNVVEFYKAVGVLFKKE